MGLSGGLVVNGTGEARGLDEALDELGRGIAAFGSACGQATAVDGEDVHPFRSTSITELHDAK